MLMSNVTLVGMGRRERRALFGSRRAGGVIDEGPATSSSRAYSRIRTLTRLMNQANVDLLWISMSLASDSPSLRHPAEILPHSPARTAPSLTNLVLTFCPGDKCCSLNESLSL